jgi:dephospho-CoA kinase
MDKLWVIGISGTNGAGKDTVGMMLAEHHNYLFVSVTDLLRTECRRRKLPVERANLRMISAEWRREHGLGVLVDKAVAEYEVDKDKYTGVVIASLRNPGEADRIHELGGTMLWIDADPRVRYGRIQSNKEHRGDRKAEDSKTFEEFLSEEKAEMYTSGDAATLNMLGVKDRCESVVNNSNEDIEASRLHVEQTLGLGDGN